MDPTDSKAIEADITPLSPSRAKKSIPGDYTQSPAVWRPQATDQDQESNTCRSCGQSKWWRLNKPDSKRICGRCHPPAPGLDVALMNEKTEGQA